MIELILNILDDILLSKKRIDKQIKAMSKAKRSKKRNRFISIIINEENKIKYYSTTELKEVKKQQPTVAGNND